MHWNSFLIVRWCFERLVKEFWHNSRKAHQSLQMTAEMYQFTPEIVTRPSYYYLSIISLLGDLVSSSRHLGDRNLLSFSSHTWRGFTCKVHIWPAVFRTIKTLSLHWVAHIGHSNKKIGCDYQTALWAKMAFCIVLLKQVSVHRARAAAISTIELTLTPFSKISLGRVARKQTSNHLLLRRRRRRPFSP